MGGDAVTMLTEARAAGFEVRIAPGQLILRGPRSQERVARQLLARKAEVVAALFAEDADITWRAAVMRPQVPARGPIPVLVVRDIVPVSGSCISCGDPLPAHASLRCLPCARAVWAVLHEMREDV